MAKSKNLLLDNRHEGIQIGRFIELSYNMIKEIDKYFPIDNNQTDIEKSVIKKIKEIPSRDKILEGNYQELFMKKRGIIFLKHILIKYTKIN